MISDQDIIKLKEVFATKDDLKGFATKDDLKGFATKDDLKGFATKDDLKGFATNEALADLRLEVGELHDKMDSIETKIDGLAGLLHASLEEHGAGAVHLARHDRQIDALAIHTGVVLPD